MSAPLRGSFPKRSTHSSGPMWSIDARAASRAICSCSLEELQSSCRQVNTDAWQPMKPVAKHAQTTTWAEIPQPLKEVQSACEDKKTAVQQTHVRPLKIQHRNTVTGLTANPTCIRCTENCAI